MNLHDVLSGVIPAVKQGYLRDSFDVIGDIAVVVIPPEIAEYRQEIALGVLSLRRNIRTVLAKSSPVERDERVPGYEILVGRSMLTEHREYGYRYRLDLSEVFFTGRLSSERQRVTGKVQPGELVLVPFCGVGPFVIPAADRGATVTAVENNPAAVHWLRENLALNRVEDRVTVLEADAFSLPVSDAPPYDRVICPTPYGRDEILDVLSPLVRDGGVLHFYTFKGDRQIPGLIDDLEKKGYFLLSGNRCGWVAPGIGRYVFDLRKG
ncbi:MAG: methyltransferase domain-containing protein [Methanomicrobiales archaeon]|nr:methyltransferase domain-containing protein [Methanomicrobiales archaeon]NYT20444.1 methyltransferase domain-containing protein [Methanomicrobiales archaeon]